MFLYLFSCNILNILIQHLLNHSQEGKEWHKKTCTLEITDFFQKHNLQTLVVYLICHLLLFLAALFATSQLSFPTRWHLTPSNFILTFLSTSPHKILWIFEFIQMLKGLEAGIQRCSVKKLFWKFSENSHENTCGGVLF